MTFASTDNPAALTPAGGPVPLERVLRRIREVSTLPQIALRTVEICNDPAAGAADLRRLLESDPALSSRVLKCVNAASNGLVRRIACLQEAIAYLGFGQIRNLAISASVSDIFRQRSVIGSYQRQHLWEHMVSVAVGARLLATRVGLTNFEDAFLAGLLHDLGVILEDQYVHRGFEQVIAALAPEQQLCHLEQKLLGFDHATLGSRVAGLWNFPKGITSIIRFHHMPQNYRGDQEQLLACVALSNYLCSARGPASVGVHLVTCHPWVIDTLKLTRNDLKVLIEDLQAELRNQRTLLGVLTGHDA